MLLQAMIRRIVVANVRDVLPPPQDSVLVAQGDQRQKRPRRGVDIECQPPPPVGCGLGLIEQRVGLVEHRGEVGKVGETAFLQLRRHRGFPLVVRDEVLQVVEQRRVELDQHAEGAQSVEVDLAACRLCATYSKSSVIGADRVEVDGVWQTSLTPGPQQLADSRERVFH